MRPSVWVIGLVLLLLGYSASLAAAQAVFNVTTASGGSLPLSRSLMPGGSLPDGRPPTEADAASASRSVKPPEPEVQLKNPSAGDQALVRPRTVGGLAIIADGGWTHDPGRPATPAESDLGQTPLPESSLTILGLLGAAGCALAVLLIRRRGF